MTAGTARLRSPPAGDPVNDETPAQGASRRRDAPSKPKAKEESTTGTAGWRPTAFYVAAQLRGRLPGNGTTRTSTTLAGETSGAAMPKAQGMSFARSGHPMTKKLAGALTCKILHHEAQPWLRPPSPKPHPRRLHG